jgi:hypothetical protein
MTPQTIAKTDPQVVALAKTCQDFSTEHSLDRFEIAVKSRISTGIADDNDLRAVDSMLHQVTLAADALEEEIKPPIAVAFARHRAMTALAGTWRNRWAGLKNSLSLLVLAYNRAKADQAQRQQAEIDKAAEEQRKRLQAEARVAMRSGNMAAATAAIAEAQNVVAPVIMVATPKLDYSHTRKEWQVKIVDPMAMVKAIAAGTAPIEAIKEWGEYFLKCEAARRGGLPEHWGVKAWQEEALSTKRS